jgi:GT2 family glycosyltransferase
MPADRPSPSVTVVLSTYNRPDALRAAIRSVLRQTFPGWRLLVLGDHCEPSTEEVMRSFTDPRIIFANLPFRFGEQAGPNSVGMALAETRCIAFLNHDDVWLPDHLERALAALAAPTSRAAATLRAAPPDARGADIFIGRAAVASRSVSDGNDGRRPLFDKATPIPGPPRHHLFHRHFTVCEPASACVFRGELARRVGLWRSHRQVHRSPLQDWFLRLWRHGARFVYGEEVTLLNLGTHYQRAAEERRHEGCGAEADRGDLSNSEVSQTEANRGEEGCYAASSPEHAWVDDLLERLPADDVRSKILESAGGALRPRRARKGIRTSNPAAKLLFHLAVNRATAHLHRRTGIDLHSAWMTLAGRRRGEAMNALSRLRTGSAPPAHADFAAAVERAVAAVRPALDRNRRGREGADGEVRERVSHG